MIQLRFRERFVLGEYCHGVSDWSRSYITAEVWVSRSGPTLEICRQFECARRVWCRENCMLAAHTIQVVLILRHTRAKGKRLGRPKRSIDAGQVASLRASSLTISRKMELQSGRSSPPLKEVINRVLYRPQWPQADDSLIRLTCVRGQRVF